MSNSENHIDWSKWDSKEDCFKRYKHVVSKLIYGSLPVKKADISVMIPTFRRASLLKKAIDSALAQKTQYSFTITVVDNDEEIDQETDSLLKMYCSKYHNIIYYRNSQNIGLFGNWNRCIELTQTEWMVMLHDDDMLKENYIEIMFTIAQKKQYGILCCAQSYLDERNIEKKLSEENGFGPLVSFFERQFIKIRGKHEIPMKSKDFLRGLSMATSVFLVRTENAISLGGFNEDYFPISDQVFNQKIIKYFTGALVAQQLYFYRITSNESLKKSVTYNILKYSSDLMEETQRQEGKSEKYCKKMYWEKMTYLYNTHLDTKDMISFSNLKNMFGIPDKYNNWFIKTYIVGKYILRWGLLLFRF